MPSQGLHFCQWLQRGTFHLYDYGSAAANRAHYGEEAPPDLGRGYELIDAPVDLLAGLHDGIVPPVNTRLHYERMSRAGVAVTYRELPYGHLDFTMSANDELRHYVLRCLRK